MEAGRGRSGTSEAGATPLDRTSTDILYLNRVTIMAVLDSVGQFGQPGLSDRADDHCRARPAFWRIADRTD